MGILKKTTEEINALFDKVDGMPAEGVVGKTPVLTTGNTTTLEPGAQATSNVVNIGTDAEGNPKYRIDFGIPKGADGQDGSSSGGGGVADSVQWSKVLNKPAWVDSPSKPSYTASEVNAIAIGGLKTINGYSLEGEGNIEISGGGSSGGGIPEAPIDGKVYARAHGNWYAPNILNSETIDEISGANILNEVVDQPIDVSIFGDIISGNPLQSYQRMKLYDFIFAGTGIANLGITNGFELQTNEEEDTIVRYMVNATQKDGTPSIVYIDVNFTKSTYSTKIHKISGGLSDAPKDGNTYGRNNGNWVVVSNEGGGSGGTAEVNIIDIYERISSAGDGGKATQEDYNTLLNYANTNTKVTIELPQGYGRFPYVGLFQMEGVIVINTTQLIYGLSFGNEVYVISPTLDIRLMTSGTLPKAIKLDGYQKPSSYTAITSEDSIQSAIEKLEAGIGGSSSGGGDNRYKLKKEIASIQTGSTSEEISTAVGGIDEYNAIIQAVKDGKKLYISEDEGYSEFMASIVGGNMLILQGIGMGFFGSNAVGVLNIVITDKGFEAYSYDVNITEVPSKS